MKACLKTYQKVKHCDSTVNVSIIKIFYAKENYFLMNKMSLKVNAFSYLKQRSSDFVQRDFSSIKFNFTAKILIHRIKSIYLCLNRIKKTISTSTMLYHFLLKSIFLWNVINILTTTETEHNFWIGLLYEDTLQKTTLDPIASGGGGGILGCTPTYITANYC